MISPTLTMTSSSPAVILRSCDDRRDEVVDEREDDQDDGQDRDRARGQMDATGMPLLARVVDDHVERAAVARRPPRPFARPDPASSAGARWRRDPCDPAAAAACDRVHARDDAPRGASARRAAGTTTTREDHHEQDDRADPPERHCGLLSATIAALRAMPGSAPRMMSNWALIALTEPSSGRRCCASTPSSADGERREAGGDPLEALAHDDQRGRPARARRRPPGATVSSASSVVLLMLPPNPSVRAFM